VWLAPAQIAAQASYAGAAAAGSKGLEVVISVWNSHGEIPMENIGIEILEQSNLLTNVTLEPQRMDRLPPKERLDLIVRFDIVAGAPTDAIAAIKLGLSADAGVFIDPTPSFEIAIAPDPMVTVCAIRAEAPDDFPVENAIDYCAADAAVANEYDRVAVFFTPSRDLREPLVDREPFIWRILGPNGHGQSLKSGGTSGAFAPEIEGGRPPAKAGSPGRFVSVIDLWDRRDSSDPAAARSGPGTYTVQTIAAEYDQDAGGEVFGGGEGAGDSVTVRVVGANDDGRPVFATWEDTSTFEVTSARLHFQGFVTEQVRDVWIQDHPSIGHGKLTIGDPNTSGSSVTLDASATWTDLAPAAETATVARDVLPAAQPEHTARSLLSIDFPAELAPGHEEMGDITVRLEALERGDLFFTAGMNLLLPTGQLPPDRHLVEGNNQPVSWAPDGGDAEEIYCFGRALADWDSRFISGGWRQAVGNEEGIRVDTLWWLWPRQSMPGNCLVMETSVADVDLTLLAGHKDGVAGRPARSLAGHLHDLETLWVIPVFITLTDDAMPTGRSLSMKTYGYAIYAVEPGTYTGPLPASAPAAGDGPDAAPPGEQTDPADPSGDLDDPSADPDGEADNPPDVVDPGEGEADNPPDVVDPGDGEADEPPDVVDPGVNAVDPNSLDPPPNAWAAFASSTSDPGTWSRSWSKSSQQEAEAGALAGCQGRPRPGRWRDARRTPRTAGSAVRSPVVPRTHVPPAGCGASVSVVRVWTQRGLRRSHRAGSAAATASSS